MRFRPVTIDKTRSSVSLSDFVASRRIGDFVARTLSGCSIPDISRFIRADNGASATGASVEELVLPSPEAVSIFAPAAALPALACWLAVLSIPVLESTCDILCEPAGCASGAAAAIFTFLCSSVERCAIVTILAPLPRALTLSGS